MTGRFTSGGGGSSSGDGFNLGNAYGAVVIDVSGVGAAMQQAQNAIQSGLAGIGDRMSAIGDTMSRVGASISLFSAPIAIASKKGLDAAADFDMLLKQIEIFGNVAPGQLDTVRQFALKMGADTKFSSADAAAALLELLKAGQSVQDAMQTLPHVLSLAATGNLSLASSSGIVSSALAIFKLNAGDAARVSNALARAANASRADVGDLGMALTNVGPVAAQFGMSVEDVSAVLGVFANNGIMGAEAGTQLKSMLLNMSRSTDDTKAAWKALNTSLYDSNGNVRNLNDVIKDLDAALDKMPVQQQNKLMHDLGGSYGIVGLNALRAAGGIDTMLGAMQAAPDAMKVADSFMGTFRGKVESLTGSIETLMISSMTPYMNDVLTPMVTRITEVVNSITDWVNANPELTKQIVRVLGIVSALGPALLIAGRAISTIGEIIGVVASPLGLIGAALFGLYKAFDSNFLGIRDLLEPFIQNFVANLDEIWGSIQNFTSNLENFGLGTAIASVVDSVMEALGLAANSDEMDATAQAIGDGIANAFATVSTFITQTVMPVLGQIANWFLNEALPAIINFVQNVAIPGIQTFFKFLGDVWAIVGPVLAQVADWFLNTALPAVMGFINNTVIPGIGKFIETLGNIWTQVSPLLAQLVKWFTEDAIPGVLSFIQNTVIPGIQDFVDIMQGIWIVVQPELDKLWKWMTQDALPEVQRFINDTVIPAIEDFRDIIEGIWRTVEPALTSLKNWFTSEALPKINEAIQTVMDQYITPFKNLLTGLWTAIQPHLQGIYNWFRDSFAKIGEFIQPVINFINDIVDKATTALDMLRQIGGGAPRESSADIVQRGLPANLQPGAALPRDLGGPGMAGMAYQIGSGQLQNEVYIPGADGQFVSGFVDLMKQVAANVSGGNGGGGDTINVMMPAAALESPAAAEANGRIFGRAFREEMYSQGVRPTR